MQKFAILAVSESGTPHRDGELLMSCVDKFAPNLWSNACTASRALDLAANLQMDLLDTESVQ